MTQYIVSRVATVVPDLFLISLFVFSIMHLLPGDPAMLILQGQSASTPEQISKLREELGLNKPIYVQYGLFLKGAIQGNLGRSVQFKEPVTSVIMERLPSTVELTASAMLFAVVIGIGFGILAAVKQHTWI